MRCDEIGRGDFRRDQMEPRPLHGFRYGALRRRDDSQSAGGNERSQQSGRHTWISHLGDLGRRGTDAGQLRFLGDRCHLGAAQDGLQQAKKTGHRHVAVWSERHRVKRLSRRATIYPTERNIRRQSGGRKIWLVGPKRGWRVHRDVCARVVLRACDGPFHRHGAGARAASRRRSECGSFVYPGRCDDCASSKWLPSGGSELFGHRLVDPDPAYVDRGNRRVPAHQRGDGQLVV